MGDRDREGLETTGAKQCFVVWSLGLRCVLSPGMFLFLCFLYYTNYLLTCRLLCTSTNTSPPSSLHRGSRRDRHVLSLVFQQWWWLAAPTNVNPSSLPLLTPKTRLRYLFFLTSSSEGLETCVSSPFYIFFFYCTVLGLETCSQALVVFFKFFFPLPQGPKMCLRPFFSVYFFWTASHVYRARDVSLAPLFI